MIRVLRPSLEFRRQEQLVGGFAPHNRTLEVPWPAIFVIPAAEMVLFHVGRRQPVAVPAHQHCS